jgi:hypothetical protein
MATATLRPNALVTNNGASIGGGAGSLNAATSDNSDTTYGLIQDDESFRVGLGDYAPVAGSVVKGVRMRVRWARDSGSQTGRLQSRFIASGAVGVEYVESLYASGTPATVTTWTEDRTFSEAELDGGDLEVLKEDGPDLRVHELYLDVIYVAIPTVTITSPSGTITTDDTPTVEWSEVLDGDGGAQTHYRVAIMANGQHPDSGTPVEDSGILVGADTSWTPEDSLPNATYDIYVKVAQTVNGSQHWSAWDDQQDVVINVATPAAPTITLTADDPNARVKIEVAQGAAGSVSTDSFQIQRSDDGVTWEDVRDVAEAEIAAVVGVGTYSDSADGTTHNANLPIPYDGGGIQENDLLIAFAAFDGNPTIAWPTDWTEIKDEAGNGSAVRAGVAWKRAIGGESGTIAITTSASEGGGVRIFCIRGASLASAPAISSGVSSAAANANPDSLDPGGWATENTLWIAAVAVDGGIDVTAAPAGYFDLGATRWNNAAGATIATAFKRASASSEDPGAFTHAAEDTRAFTVAVRPLNVAPVAYDYDGLNGVDSSYRARALHTFSTGTNSASAWSATGTEGWSSALWFLKHPYDPDLNLGVIPRSQPSARRTSRQGVFNPLNRVDPIIIADKRTGWQGELVLRVDDVATRAALDALLEDSVPLLLQAPPDMDWDDRWLVFGDLERARAIDAGWSEVTFDSLPWWEVEAPDA